jgi:hypothetical protein
MKDMKRRAMSLGNRLARKGNGMTRSAAFKRAWAIVKAGGMVLAVRGVMFGSRQEALKHLSGYRPQDVRAFVVPEPGNRADHGALAVWVGVQNGRRLYRLGYISAGETATVRALPKQRAALRVLAGNIYGARLRMEA